MTNVLKVSASQVVSMDMCKAKGYFEGLGLESFKGKSYLLSILVKNLFQKMNDFSLYNRIEILNYLDAGIEDSYFVSTLSKKEELAVLTEQILRYASYEENQNRKIIRKNMMGDVQVDTFTVSVSADFAIETDTHVEIIKIKKGEPKLSYQGRKFEAKPENNIELFLLTLLGKQLYPDKKVVSSFYHLKSKDDKKHKFSPTFDEKKGKNIISHCFYPEQAQPITSRITDLLSEELTIESEKTCDTSICEFCSFANVCRYESGEKMLEKVQVEDVKKAGELKLTKSQYDAIFFRDGIARINAGAGSGKTTTIALRVAELLQEGVLPENILLITFSNKGAQEMREKIAYWLKEMEITSIKVESLNIFTFNGWGEKIIRKEHTLLGFSSPPELLDKVQQYDLIFEILDKNEKLEALDYKNPLMDFPNAKGAVVQLANYFEAIKGNYLMSAMVCSKKLNLAFPMATKVFDLYNQYNQLLKGKNLIEYQDQINLVFELMENHPNVYATYAYQHIIVDEFQDSDVIQLDLISGLTDQELFQSLMVVGDDAQSIYRFRHANQENILNFHTFFEEVKDIFFLENFRSTPEIIETANRLNDLNKNKLEKQLISKSPHGDKPVLFSYGTPTDEYAGISNIVEEHLSLGVKPEDIAILARTKGELFAIRSHLKAKNIPTHLNVAESLLSNKNVQIMISLVDFFENEACDYSLFEYLYIFNRDRFQTMKSEEVNKFVTAFKQGFLSTYQNLETEADKINYFYETIKEIADIDSTVADFLEDLKGKKFMSTSALFSNLKKMVLYNDEKQIVKEEVTYKAITLSTVHSSKGKEFDIVISTIDKFKHDASTLEDVEEERRILFVAITRAKKRLYVTHHTNQDRVKIKGSYNKFADELSNVKKLS